MNTLDLLTGVLFATAKVGVLVAMAATLALSLRRAPAAARYGVWVATLAGALLLPVVTPWVPSWALWTVPAPLLAPPELEAPAPAPSHEPDFSEARAVRASRIDGARACIDCAATLTAVDSSGARLSRIRLTTWLLGLWVAGVAVIFLRLGRALYSVRRLEKEAGPVGGAWLDELEGARDRVGVRRGVRVLRSPRIHSPMTWGVLHPVILLPEASRDWDQERRRIVLHHELSHVHRGDWVARTLALGVCALYWLNPLVWLARHRLVLEQEKACDEAVVALGDRPSSYARHLLAIATSMGRRSQSPALALDMARRSQMEGRLMSILDESLSSRVFGKHHGRHTLLIPALVLIGLVPALAAVEPWVDEEVVGVQVPGITLDAGADQSAAFRSGAVTGAAPGAERAPDTSRVSRALAELHRLERQMEPFERQLEAIESEMESVENEIEGVEGRLEPIEEELEAQEAELEPFEERLEAMERELEPYEARLEAVETELEPFEERLEAVELELEPYEEQLETLADELEPYEDRLEAIEDELEPYEDQLTSLEEGMEPLDDEIERLDEQYEATDSVAERERLRTRMKEIRRDIEPIHTEMRAVHERMRPVHERMRSIHEEMGPVHERMRSIHEQMQPVYERMNSIHEEMRPVHDRMSSIHEEMRPVHERMRSIHEEMGPVHERMRVVHERMQPVHEAMGEHHERMQPHHRKMGEVHDRMKPLHEEMAVQHRVMQQELVGFVEELLAAHLGSVVAAGTDFSGAASEIVDHSAIRIDDGRLRMLSSMPAMRGFLQERFGTESGPAFEAAVERFLEAYANLEITAA